MTYDESEANPLPTGTITFLFTDIEGSTKLWEQHPQAMQQALAHHDVLLRNAIEAHGGQTLLSLATEELVRAHLPEGAGLRDQGEHRLKDLARPEHVFQLLHPSLPDDFPPLQSLSALSNNLPLQVTSFVGREREMADL